MPAAPVACVERHRLAPASGPHVTVAPCHSRATNGREPHQPFGRVLEDEGPHVRPERNDTYYASVLNRTSNSIRPWVPFFWRAAAAAGRCMRRCAWLRK